MLLLLLACTGDKNPGETAAPDDTQDTVADTVVETAESDSGVDTAESDTGDSGDTAPPVAWAPGDDIPGWEDADCTEPHPGKTFEITFPDIYVAEASFLQGMHGAGPHLLDLGLRDCSYNPPCSTDSFHLDYPYLLTNLDGTAGDGGVARGLGEWGPDADGLRQVVGSGRSMLADWSNDGTLVSATVTVCIARMRPDELRGALRAEIAWGTYPYNFQFYDSLVFRFPFEVHFEDHAGFDLNQADIPEDKPLGYVIAHYLYDQPYDEAWPWDDVTDPTIREQVYERYTPYNLP